MPSPTKPSSAFSDPPARSRSAASSWGGVRLSGKAKRSLISHFLYIRTGVQLRVSIHAKNISASSTLANSWLSRPAPSDFGKCCGQYEAAICQAKPSRPVQAGGVTDINDAGGRAGLSGRSKEKACSARRRQLSSLAAVADYRWQAVGVRRVGRDMSGVVAQRNWGVELAPYAPARFWLSKL